MNGNIIKNMTQDTCYIEIYDEVGITVSNVINGQKDPLSDGKLLTLDDNGNYISTKMNGGIQEIVLTDLGPVENGDSTLLYVNSENYGLYHRNKKSRSMYTFPGEEIKCLVNVMERFFPSPRVLDSQRISVEIPLGENIFSLYVNGTAIKDFSYDSALKIITLGESSGNIIRNFNNNVSAITYKSDQTTYGQVKFSYSSFETVFDPISVSTGEYFKRDKLTSMDNYESLSVNNSSEFFHFQDKGDNGKKKYLLNKQNELSFTLYRDTKNRPLDEMVNGKKFRVVLYNEQTKDFIYYTNCTLKEGVQLTKSKAYDTVQVNLSADDIFTIYFSVDGYNQGLYGLGLYGNSYRFEVM